MLVNAAVLYANLKYEEGQWYGDLLGATSGGTKVSVKSDFKSHRQRIMGILKPCITLKFALKD